MKFIVYKKKLNNYPELKNKKRLTEGYVSLFLFVQERKYKLQELNGEIISYIYSESYALSSHT